MSDETLTIPQVAALAGATAPTIRNAIASGRLPTQRVPGSRHGRWGIDKADVESFAQSITPEERRRRSRISLAWRDRANGVPPGETRPWRRPKPGPKPQPLGPDELNLAQAAAFLGCKYDTVLLNVRRGRFPARVFEGPGGSPRYALRKSDIENWCPMTSQEKGRLGGGKGGQTKRGPWPREGGMSLQEAAAVAGRSETTLRNAIRSGALPARKAPIPGTKRRTAWVIRPEDLAGWIKGNAAKRSEST